MSRPLKVVLWLVVAGVVVFAAIQFVPYGRAHQNPSVTAEPAWDGPRTEELVRAACYDCHSNETVWPWYTYIAPASWLVTRDVEEGRQRMNFSEWDFTPEEAGFVAVEIAEVVGEGEMPPLQYRLLHSEARLSDEEKQALIDGIRASLGQ